MGFVIRLVDAQNEDNLIEIWKTRVYDKDYQSFRRSVGYVRNADMIKAKRRDAVSDTIRQTQEITNAIQPN